MQTTRKTEATASARRLAPLTLSVAQTALQYLHALMAAIDGVRQAEGPAGVHRVRVASRRRRSVLPLRRQRVPVRHASELHVLHGVGYALLVYKEIFL